MTLGEFLKNERLKRNLTQAQMAKKLNCSLPHYKGVEKGKRKAGVNLQNSISKLTRKSTTFIWKLYEQEGK